AVVCLVPAPPELQGVVTDGAGGAIAAWKDARNGHAELYAIRWLADGSVAPGWNASGSLLAIAPGARGPAVVAADGEAGALAVWEDTRGVDADLYAQRFTGAGVPAAGWPAAGLPICTAIGDQSAPALAIAGGVVRIAWEDRRYALTGPDVFATELQLDGSTAVRLSIARLEAL